MSMTEADLIDLLVSQQLGFGMPLLDDGVPVPQDQDYWNKNATMMKKFFDMMGDPFFAGATGGHDPYAYQPTVEYEDVYTASNPAPVAPWEQYAQADPTSIEARIANGLRPEVGLTPSQIMQGLEIEPGMEEYVEQEIARQAAAAQAWQAAPKDENGQLLMQVANETPSEAASRYHELGLPDPGQEWQLDDFRDVTGSKARAEETRGAVAAVEQVLKDLQAEQEEFEFAQRYQNADGQTTPVRTPDDINQTAPVRHGEEQNIQSSSEGMGNAFNRLFSGESATSPVRTAAAQTLGPALSNLFGGGTELGRGISPHAGTSRAQGRTQSVTPDWAGSLARNERERGTMDDAARSARLTHHQANREAVGNEAYARRRRELMNQSGLNPTQVAIMERLSGFGR